MVRAVKVSSSEKPLPGAASRASADALASAQGGGRDAAGEPVDANLIALALRIQFDRRSARTAVGIEPDPDGLRGRSFGVRGGYRNIQLRIEHKRRASV